MRLVNWELEGDVVEDDPLLWAAPRRQLQIPGIRRGLHGEAILHGRELVHAESAQVPLLVAERALAVAALVEIVVCFRWHIGQRHRQVVRARTRETVIVRRSWEDHELVAL